VAVRDVQQRLVRAGFEPGRDQAGEYGPGTEEALRRFQSARGVHVDGVCGLQTWNALIEAGFRLGDRLLYQRSPMLRGDDITDLQVRLGALGFDAGRPDGIFGPQTATAVVDFQRNAGLTTDGICGPDVLDELTRLSARVGPTTKAGVRESEALRRAPRQLASRRILVADGGGLGALAQAVARALQDAGALVIVAHHPDGSAQAVEANGFEADLFCALVLRDEDECHACFWATTGYESLGGRRLAELLAEAVSSVEGLHPVQTRGMRLPSLRETRMPAAVCELGPPAAVVRQTASIAAAVREAVTRWVREPIEVP
jgi:N-acetylmuramoyl-L-alanine amidase